MREMFSGCTSLTTIYVGEGWSTEKVENAYFGYDVFNKCRNLWAALERNMTVIVLIIPMPI